MKLILGVGSPFGQDNIARLIIDAINKRLPGDVRREQEIHVKYSDRPGLALIELIKPYDEVLIIDAVVSGSLIGTIHCLVDLRQLSQYSHTTSSHGFGVAEALSLAETLGQLPDKLAIYGIEIDHKASQISSLLQKRLDVLASKIVNSSRT